MHGTKPCSQRAKPGQQRRFDPAEHPVQKLDPELQRREPAAKGVAPEPCMGDLLCRLAAAVPQSPGHLSAPGVIDTQNTPADPAEADDRNELQHGLGNLVER